MCFIKLTFIILFYGAASEALDNPAIQYCFYSAKSLISSRECTLTQISNSTFQFGKTDRNVLKINIWPTLPYLLLKCSAPYPIRWLAVKPLRNISLLSNPDTNRLAQNPLSTTIVQYSQEVAVDLRKQYSRILHCEGFDDTTRSADVFVNPVIGDHAKMSIDTESGNYFLGVQNVEATGYTVLPCVADAFKGSFKVKAVRTHKMDGVISVITEDCVECICRASSNCSSFPCQSSNVCGELHEEYWRGEQAKVITDTAQCKSDSSCAKRVLREYLSDSRSKLVDCNGDALVTCEDAARFHMNGKIENCNERKLSNAFAECLHEKKENFTLLRTQPADFDPRIGMRIHEPIDFDANYECVAQTTTTSATYGLVPLNPGKQLQVLLSLQEETGQIKCELKTTESFLYPSPNLFVGKCKSLTECELKFKPLFPDVFPTGKKALLGYFEEFKPTSRGPTVGHFTTYNQGYLHCTAAYSVTGEFVSTLGYFFTGLDNKKYIYSEPYPKNSIIRMKSQNADNMTSGRTYNFSCQISTFVLLPNIQFVVGYSNGELKHGIKSREPNSDVSILTSNIDDENATLTWSMELIAKTSMIRVTCYAPQITSDDWAGAELRLMVAESTASAPISIDGNHLNLYVIAGISVAVAVFLTVCVLLFVVLRRLSASVATIQTLATEEKEDVEGFGNAEKKYVHSPDGVVPKEDVVFRELTKISSSQLRIEDVILGEGHFGIVRRGVYREKPVAVKCCKPNAKHQDLNAFLKELTMLSFIGEHSNIVRFYGAVVENMHQGEYLAVFELTQIGNLHGYLRAIVRKNEQNTLNRSILTSFCRQIASGMEYLSNKDVMHGDLAARNVLIFEKNIVKVTDFGLAKNLLHYRYSNYTKKQKVHLPWRWLALESLRYCEFSTQSDVWSFGVTMWEIFSLAKVPFSLHTFSDDFIDKIESGYRLGKPNLASNALFDWMSKCWKNLPEDRPTFAECKVFLMNAETTVHAADGIHGMVTPV